MPIRVLQKKIDANVNLVATTGRPLHAEKTA